MPSRYDQREIGVNKTEIYQNIMEDRGIRQIRQYFTPSFSYPSPEQIDTLEITHHIWTTSDRYYKLASDHYNNPEMWWVIAFFNQKPTEAHVKIGDVIKIPKPIDKVLRVIKF